MENKHNPVTLERLRELKNFEQLDGVTSVIKKVSHKETRQNKVYTELTLLGKNCEYEAKMWETGKFTNILDEYVNKSVVVEINLKRKDHEGQYGLTAELVKMREDLDTSEEAYGTQRLLDKTKFNVELYVSWIQDEGIRRVCQKFIETYEGLIKTHPAGAKVHHDFIGGWEEHTVEVISGGLSLMRSDISTYPHKYTDKQVDRFICMALFHDAGKMYEMDANGEYTLWGKAVGHTHLSTVMFNTALVEAGVTLNNEDYLIILNGILSHHGEIEWGAVKEPISLEANLLHLMDMHSLHLSKFIGYSINPPMNSKDNIIRDFSRRRDYFIDSEMEKWRD